MLDLELTTDPQSYAPTARIVSWQAQHLNCFSVQAAPLYSPHCRTPTAQSYGFVNGFAATAASASATIASSCASSSSTVKGCTDLTAPPFSSSIVNWRAPRSALTLMTPHNISPPSNVSATPHAPSGRPSPKGSVSSSIRRSKYSSAVIAAQRNECGASDTLIRIE